MSQVQILHRDYLDGAYIEVIYPDQANTYTNLILIHAMALDAFLKQTLKGFGAFGHCTGLMQITYTIQNIDEWAILCLYAIHAQILAALLKNEFADLTPITDSLPNIRAILIAFAEYIQEFQKYLEPDVEIPDHVNPEAWLEVAYGAKPVK